ncbi:glycine cleavage system aminomethyltransferase GcvT [Nocardioides mangrovicus]|uniref:Aminomethyltransferase n=1 Tax=Nocardioides mangrovicus TaxID=2478913 RepID=A0A3L8P327_9ACTN|nr:glycine cleavage system aminomethyltransferase GcvT [Nocardioides mangrovicus]RLV49740.1 glycine cleavage system aminomethyltransferase GcvT [Nocardioides mangrovicus]
MSRQTALHSVHTELGASFTDFAGWSMPVRYTSETAEHHAVRTTAGLFDLSHMGEIKVTGPDAGRVLDRAVVGTPSRIGLGRARYSMICNDAGGILDDLVVYRLADHDYLVVANASNVDVVATALSERTTDEAADAQVSDKSQHCALLAVQGPAAVTILAGLGDDHVTALKYYSIARTKVAGHDVLLARTGYTGEDGYEVYCSPSVAPDLWRQISAAGERYGLVPAGLACRDTLRLEAGMPLYGHELDADTNPFEAGLGRVISFDKPNRFVGDTALRRFRDLPRRRSLVGLATSGRRAPRAGYDVVDRAGNTVGRVTSGAPSPTLGYPIAMAYVEAGHNTPGTELAVDLRGTREPALVVDLPFYQRPSA